VIADVLEGRSRWTVEQGDCLDVMRSMPDACVDALVTDPPAGIGFMGKSWDHDKGGRDVWVAWLAARMREAYRVMKPGAHGLVWALPRTSHWTAYALEDAGFEVVDRLSHIFGSGFPKSVDVSKAIDKAAGVERAVVGPPPWGANRKPNAQDGDAKLAQLSGGDLGPHPGVTAPATDEAKRWAGWGTALKPAVEDWWLIRKPRRDTIVRTVRAHGTGALNIDGCRVPHASAKDLEAHAAGVAAIKARGGSMENSWANHSDLAGASDVTALGRWPSHLLLTHADACELVGTKRVKAPPAWYDTDRPASLFTGAETSPVHHSDGDGFETVDDWRCVDGCPVKLLDEQSGDRPGAVSNGNIAGNGYGGGYGVISQRPGYADEGGASRYFTTFAPFFYTGKAKRTDRELGCDHLPAKSGAELAGRAVDSPGLKHGRSGASGRDRRNHHPTVKSTDLMRYLCRLVTPPNGIVLDTFCGSGSTGVGCSAEGFRFIGIDGEPDYVEIARARIVGDAPLLNVGGLR
jgi:hypothetical protein